MIHLEYDLYIRTIILKPLLHRISILSDSDDDINGVQNQSDVISMFKNIEEELLNSVIVKGTSNITNIVMNQIPLLGVEC